MKVFQEKKNVKIPAREKNKINKQPSKEESIKLSILSRPFFYSESHMRHSEPFFTLTIEMNEIFITFFFHNILINYEFWGKKSSRIYVNFEKFRQHDRSQIAQSK